MYTAEIKGKIPSSLMDREDLLTSYVFSFFKYADRRVFFSELINRLGLSVSNADLINAEFEFWPKYDERTEPDLVTVVGKYYLLWEAKLKSGFGQKSDKHESQLKREIESGRQAAHNISKEFILIAITEDYNEKLEKYEDVDRNKINFKWINWQSITDIIEKVLETYGERIPDKLMVDDFYNVLLKRNLRSFRSILEIQSNPISWIPDQDIFFSIRGSRFTDVFSGFSKISTFDSMIQSVPDFVFYRK